MAILEQFNWTIMTAFLKNDIKINTPIKIFIYRVIAESHYKVD